MYVKHCLRKAAIGFLSVPLVLSSEVPGIAITRVFAEENEDEIQTKISLNTETKTFTRKVKLVCDGMQIGEISQTISAEVGTIEKRNPETDEIIETLPLDPTLHFQEIQAPEKKGFKAVDSSVGELSVAASAFDEESAAAVLNYTFENSDIDFRKVNISFIDASDNNKVLEDYTYTVEVPGRTVGGIFIANGAVDSGITEKLEELKEAGYTYTGAYPDTLNGAVTDFKLHLTHRLETALTTKKSTEVRTITIVPPEGAGKSQEEQKEVILIDRKRKTTDKVTGEVVSETDTYSAESEAVELPVLENLKSDIETVPALSISESVKEITNFDSNVPYKLASNPDSSINVICGDSSGEHGLIGYWMFITDDTEERDVVKSLETTGGLQDITKFLVKGHKYTIRIFAPYDHAGECQPTTEYSFEYTDKMESNLIQLYADEGMDTPPRIVVQDENGNALSGVPVSISKKLVNNEYLFVEMWNSDDGGLITEKYYEMGSGIKMSVTLINGKKVEKEFDFRDYDGSEIVLTVPTSGIDEKSYIEFANLDKSGKIEESLSYPLQNTDGTKPKDYAEDITAAIQATEDKGYDVIDSEIPTEFNPAGGLIYPFWKSHSEESSVHYDVCTRKINLVFEGNEELNKTLTQYGIVTETEFTDKNSNEQKKEHLEHFEAFKTPLFENWSASVPEISESYFTDENPHAEITIVYEPVLTASGNQIEEEAKPAEEAAHAKDVKASAEAAAPKEKTEKKKAENVTFVEKTNGIAIQPDKSNPSGSKSAAEANAFYEAKEQKQKQSETLKFIQSIFGNTEQTSKKKIKGIRILPKSGS